MFTDDAYQVLTKCYSLSYLCIHMG